MSKGQCIHLDVGDVMLLQLHVSLFWLLYMFSVQILSVCMLVSGDTLAPDPG